MDSKTKWIYGLGAYLTIFIIVLIALLLWYWPRQSTVKQPGSDPNVTTTQVSDPEASIAKQCPVESFKYIVLVLLIGALGACLHGITSLAYHCSQNNFSQQWNFWYIFRPFAGGILALIFYLIIKGGFMSPGNGNENLFYVILGISGMIGLFSNQALDRLSVIFDAMFVSLKDENAKFKPGTGMQTTTSPKNESTKRTPPKKED